MGQALRLPAERRWACHLPPVWPARAHSAPLGNSSRRQSVPILGRLCTAVVATSRAET